MNPVVVILKTDRYLLGRLASSNDEAVRLVNAASAKKGTVDLKREGEMLIPLRDIELIIREEAPPR